MFYFQYAKNQQEWVDLILPPPCPPAGTPYGYESWITVEPGINPQGKIRVKKFPGSLCAVTSIECLADIGASCKYLYELCEGSADYAHADMDGLEEVLSPVGTPEEDLSFNLWLPVTKKPK